MNATPTDARAKVSHRLTMRPYVSGGAEPAFDQAALANIRLILDSHGLAEAPSSSACSSAFAHHALKTASPSKNPGFGTGGSVAIGERLNAFFAISVNSPSVSMVNFSCCVCSAPNPRARGVTRTVTPQPKRAAVRMEAGVHAGI
jgi:hypothetical protein